LEGEGPSTAGLSLELPESGGGCRAARPLFYCLAYREVMIRLLLPLYGTRRAPVPFS
jgi:hypothetical protein